MSDFEKQSEADREWLAFRYISGELSGDELASFESELETSQVLREAVARAVELSQAIEIAELQCTEPVQMAAKFGRRKSWIYGIGWIGAGVAAASIAGAVWWNMPGPKGGPTDELVDAWTTIPAVQPPSHSSDELAEPGTALDAAEPEIAPSWMTAGVISLGGGKLEDGDGDGKPDESWDDEVLEN